jgi:hypothetical protein
MRKQRWLWWWTKWNGSSSYRDASAYFLACRIPDLESKAYCSPVSSSDASPEKSTILEVYSGGTGTASGVAEVALNAIMAGAAAGAAARLA